LIDEFHASTGRPLDEDDDGLDEHPEEGESVTEPALRGNSVSAPTPRFLLTTRHVRAVAVVAVVGVVLAGWWALAGRPSEDTLDAPVARTAKSGSSPASEAAPKTTGDVIVDVIGKVNKPGIVVLPAGSRVHEAITAAGGFTGRFDRASLNLARELVDGEQILVGISPAVPTGSGAAAGAGSTPGATGGSGTAGLININTADLATLDELPGVGPVTAQAIIDFRSENGRFASIDDLLDVPRIGEATLEKLRKLVTL
jgi:competence protein ComEA